MQIFCKEFVLVNIYHEILIGIFSIDCDRCLYHLLFELTEI